MIPDICNNLWNSYQKITYFLLAASGSAIAFTTTQTKDSYLGFTMIPLGFSILCLGYSIYCGYNHLRLSLSILESNLQQNLVVNKSYGKSPEIDIGDKPDEEILNILEDTLSEDIDNANKYFKREFISFGMGAICYLIWHFIEMIYRTI